MNLGSSLSLLLKGFVIGSANVVPGVSGGTMALILGIYEKLIDSLHQLSERSLYQKLFRGKVSQALTQVHAPFLALVIVGALIALISLARVVEQLLSSYPTFVYSFFFGLILASIWFVLTMIDVRKPRVILGFLLGSVFAFLLVGLSPTTAPTAIWFIFLSGALAFCTLILPGISGSFVLLLLGNYSFMLNAVNERDLFTLIVFGLGGLVGLLGFAKLLNWLFKHYYNMSIAILAGFMLGSLRRIWPWKRDADELSPNVLPDLSQGSELLTALVLALIGFLLVLYLSRFDKRR